ncbi:MAG: hypothetical protein KIT09_34130 [Bryobacteraceae bacterium]|nr:hypothetical protein [Bryobacteraceae bacterium]
MLWSEFSTYQARAREPFERVLGHLDTLRRHVDRCHRELKEEIKQSDEVRAKLKRLESGPYKAAASMLRAESLLAEWAARNVAETLRDTIIYSASQLRPAADVFTLGGNVAEEMNPEAVAAVVSWSALLVSVGGVVIGGPVGTAIGLLVGGADALNSLRLWFKRTDEARKREMQHRRDENLRELLDSAIKMLEDLAGTLNDLCTRFQTGCEPVLHVMRDNRERAENLLRAAT